jgi:hypothetical protein
MLRYLPTNLSRPEIVGQLSVYLIRIRGHPGATMLAAFPALAPRHHGAHTVLTGLLDRSALYGILAEIEALGLDAEIEALGLDLLELRKLTPESGHHHSA